MFLLTDEQHIQTIEEGWRIATNGALGHRADTHGRRVFTSIYDVAMFLRKRAIAGSEFHYEAYLASPWQIYDSSFANNEGWRLWVDPYNGYSAGLGVSRSHIFHDNVISPIMLAEKTENELLLEYISQQAEHSTDPLYVKALRTITKARLLQGTQNVRR
jgi:hypothetical protein